MSILSSAEDITFAGICQLQGRAVAIPGIYATFSFHNRGIYSGDCMLLSKPSYGCSVDRSADLGLVWCSCAERSIRAQYILVHEVAAHGIQNADGPENSSQKFKGADDVESGCQYFLWHERQAREKQCSNKGIYTRFKYSSKSSTQLYWCSHPGAAVLFELQQKHRFDLRWKLSDDDSVLQALVSYWEMQSPLLYWSLECNPTRMHVILGIHQHRGGEVDS